MLSLAHLCLVCTVLSICIYTHVIDLLVCSFILAGRK